MSDLTPAASWDAVVQLSGTMAGVPATWNVPNQALLNRTEWLKTFGVFKNSSGNVGIGVDASDFGAGLRNVDSYGPAGAQYRARGDDVDILMAASDLTGRGAMGTRSAHPLDLQAGGATKGTLGLDGSLLLTAGGVIGYGTGSGGTVAQATNKSTGVTLSKPSGTITMSSAALAAGASVSFTLTNTLITPLDILDVAVQWGAFTPENYRVRAACGNGVARITLENVSGGSLSEALPINFALKRVANT